MSRLPRSSRWLRAFALTALLLVPALAATSTPQRFDLPAGDAATALRLAAQQAGREIMFPAVLVQGVRVAAVRGEFTAEEAITRLLAGTELQLVRDTSSSALAIGRVPAAAPAHPLPRPAPPPSDETIQLSVFEVTGEKDLGYASSDVMTGTRTNEKLENLPNSISVMTQDFLQDLAVNDFLDAVEFATNAENIHNDSGTRGAVVGARSGNQISFRGMASIRQLRDGFPWYMPQDIYNTERIEFSRGPGGLAFGDVDVGGIINISTKRANSRRNAAAQVRFDDWGSRRFSLDVNQPLGKSGVAVRFNVIDAENESWRQRSGAEFRGYAGAVRWEPFKDHRTVVNLTYEYGDQLQGFSHVRLDDQTLAYVRGTGSVDLDADATRAGVQTNGVGMAQFAPATGNLHHFKLIDGRIYNLQSTAANVFRRSLVQVGAAVATGTDPVNPLRYPIIGVSESIVPRGQDWGGPDNTLNSKFHAYTVELQHRFTDRISVLFSHNGQKDDTFRLNFSNLNTRDVMIDVNPSLPDPTDPTRTRLIPNPRFEQLYVTHNTGTVIDGHDMQNFRAVAVFDTPLPWSITQRFVFSTGYRHEKYYKDNFTRALSREEILRRGYTGNATFYGNNLLEQSHYFSDGNGDAALADPPIPGVTTDYRDNRSGGSQRFDQSLTSGTVNVLGSYVKGKVRSSIGLSRDHWIQSAFRPLVSDPVTGELKFVDLSGALIANNGMAYIDAPLVPFSDQWVTNQTYGVVWHVLPWVSLTAGYFESTLFSDNFGLDLNGVALAPRTGEGTDYSIRFNLLDRRVNLNLTYFQNTAENIGSGVSALVRTELEPLLRVPFVNTTDYRDRGTKGFEIELVTNLTRNWTARGSFANNDVKFTRFFPLLLEKLTEAKATARSLSLDPDDATLVTQQFIEDQTVAATTSGRKNANFTTRYSFTAGRLRGLAVGASVRRIFGKTRPAVAVGGQTVLPESLTETYDVINPFVSYRHKWGRSTWNTQLNINNVLDKVTDQGTAYRYTRWTDPRQIILTFNVSY